VEQDVQDVVESVGLADLFGGADEIFGPFGWQSYCRRAFGIGGSYDELRIFGIDEGIFEVDGGIFAGFFFQFDIDRKIAYLDTIACFDGLFVNWYVVEDCFVGGIEVLDHPLAVFGGEDDGVLPGDFSVAQEDLAVKVSADVDWPLVEPIFVDSLAILFYYQTHPYSSRNILIMHYWGCFVK